MGVNKEVKSNRTTIIETIDQTFIALTRTSWQFETPGLNVLETLQNFKYKLFNLLINQAFFKEMH